jgi:type I restriction enzyme S subunit
MLTETSWREMCFREICDEIYDGPHATPEKIDRGPVFLSISSLVSGRIDLSQSAHLSEQDFVKWTRRVTPQKDDLVFSYETRLGEAALIPEGLRCCLGRRMALIRAYEDLVYPKYLLYFFLSPLLQNQIRQATICGSTVERLALADIAKFRIPLPPLAEQKAIAAVLGALDDKIELNRRMNATLESMARALFQSWFVDFDPVRAKLDGRKPEGLDEATASLFPEQFQESAVGNIPSAWSFGPITECCTRIHSGGTPRRDEPEYWRDGTVPWLTSGEVRQPMITSTESYISELGLNESAAKWIPANSTVVALYGATAGQVSFLGTSTTTNQAICSLVPKSGFEFFNYFAMRGATAEMESKAAGSAQQNISKGVIEETVAILPPPLILNQFNSIVAPLFANWIANTQQSRTLATLRDTLLPKLLSGELSVANRQPHASEESWI